MYPDVGSFVLIRPTQTFYERIKVMQRFWRSVCAGDLCLKLSCSRVRLSSAHLLNVGRSTAIAKCSGGILNRCVNSQAVYPLSEQHGLKARERRYTAHEEGKHWE